MTLTQEEAHCLFEYKDGMLLWKEMVTNRTENLVNSIAGYIHKHGYRIISAKGYQYKAHRLMFLYHHGYMPEFIDHINGIKDDNRIENLRAATKAQNNQNRCAQKNNGFGIKGVSKLKNSPNWRCRISYNNKLHELGGFESKELATEFIELWREIVHGAFANHGLKGA
tara:strand:- start:56 stop:559 length:504 start_codon:yes stop_codon:yes gene_type:complete